MKSKSPTCCASTIQRACVQVLDTQLTGAWSWLQRECSSELHAACPVPEAQMSHFKFGTGQALPLNADKDERDITGQAPGVSKLALTLTLLY